MLKNKDNTIKAAKDQAKDPKDMTVYILKHILQNKRSFW